jgi:threonine dehydratase
VVVPIGGGGLLAGMSLAIKKINPRIKVYGVEASAMPGMFKSVLAEKPTHVPRQKTMADGIAIENIGDVPFALIKDYVDEIVLVSEDEIASAILTLLEVEKTVVEGSGACALAAVMHGKLNLKGQQVGIITTGGNIDMTLLGRIIDRGLVKDGRMARIRVTIEDVPGQIAKVAAILAEQRALVREIEHERAFLGENIGYTAPMFTIETRDHEHIQTVLHAIQQGGFPSASLSTAH